MNRRAAIGGAFVAGLLLGAVGALGALYKWHREFDRLEMRRLSARLRAEQDAAIAIGYARARRPDTTRLLAPVREVRRVQALEHCAMTFVVESQRWDKLDLFNARVTFGPDDGLGSAIISQAWSYRPEGLRFGDSIQVVIPYTWCAQARVHGYGAIAVGVERPPRLVPR
jgi:hypothetical protein